MASQLVAASTAAEHDSSARPKLAASTDYDRQLDHAHSEIDRLQSLHVRLVWLRTLLFFAAAISLFLGYGGDIYPSFLIPLGWLALLGFFAAIVWHEHVRLTSLAHQSDAQLFERLLARLDRNWARVPALKLLPEFSEMACADDLDVDGSASLLGLLSQAGTLPGKRVLQKWIAQPPSWREVTARQDAIRTLAALRELRLSIIKTVLASSDGTEDVYGLPKWAAQPRWLPSHRFAHGVSYLGPAMVILGVVLLVSSRWVEWAPLSNIAAGLIGSGFVINVLLTVFWGSWIHEIFQHVTGHHNAAFQFAHVFNSFERLPCDGGLLDDIRHIAVKDESSAKKGFENLVWGVRLANLQRDPLLYIVYLVLQLSVAWDFRVLKMLESWKARFGPRVADWFEALGRCEALISGATLADENPSWAFPVPLADDELKLDARGLGHPLLPDEARVVNDLTLHYSQPLLLVTGSNMAGKSTFMRAVGLNILLARTGSPVCAERFATPMYELATSIRVRDSLRDGVSFFMAELKRLKEVVDLAHERREAHPNPLLFLLDEILQGTNSRERQIAVATVLDKLLSFNAVGLLSTHDLDLATVEEIQRVSQIVHFREFFETQNGIEQMQFDYKIRSGPTPTTNALKLLKLVGLDDPPPST